VEKNGRSPRKAGWEVVEGGGGGAELMVDVDMSELAGGWLLFLCR
jgi:hypothetical protein